MQEIKKSLIVVLFDAKIRKSLFYTLCGSKNGIKTTLLNPIKNKWTALFPDKEYFNLGTTGVIFATSISILILTIAMPIQTYFILKRQTLGVHKFKK